MTRLHSGLRTNLEAGIDEAGRGPLAGPVVAAVVVFKSDVRPAGLKDSKQLAPKRRIELADEIIEWSLDWAVAWADPAEIDGLNVLGATMLAMRRAVQGLTIWPTRFQVDGNRSPSLTAGGIEADIETVVRGDQTVPVISAASILAKVWRDAQMIKLDTLYPEYGFAAHKGYPTPFHLRMLAEFGPSPAHRRSFKPVAKYAQPSGMQGTTIVLPKTQHQLRRRDCV